MDSLDNSLSFTQDSPLERKENRSFGFKENFRLGSLTLPNNVIYAPLAGCSDYPFRKISSLYKPGLVFCEMVKMEALIRHDAGTYRILDFDQGMHPIGGQICGSHVSLAGKAAKIIEDLGFDVVDLNCGCPVDKVTKDGSGSGLLQNPEKIGEIIHEMAQSVSIPVTVKIRIGWDENSICAPEVVQIAEKAGAKAIFIHGRTRKQGYHGPADWSWIARAKEKADKILVIGNGDIFDPESATAIFSQTACDGILISRGTLGRPWIVDEIRRKELHQEKKEVGFLEVKEVLLQHYQFIINYQVERKALLDMRRVSVWYLKQCEGTKPLRFAINRASTTQEIFSLVKEFSIEESLCL